MRNPLGLALGSPEDLAERDRLATHLGRLCGLPAGASAERCGRSWCAYYDTAEGRCGLLVWDVPARLGPAALRWFARHRSVPAGPASAADLDETLAARCASL